MGLTSQVNTLDKLAKPAGPKLVTLIPGTSVGMSEVCRCQMSYFIPRNCNLLRQL
jgi:hypothetical protein